MITSCLTAQWGRDEREREEETSGSKKAEREATGELMKSVVPAANIRRKRAATRRPCTESSQNATKTKRDLICPVLIQHIFPPYSPKGKQDSLTELDWIVPAGRLRLGNCSTRERFSKGTRGGTAGITLNRIGAMKTD